MNWPFREIQGCEEGERIQLPFLPYLVLQKNMKVVQQGKLYKNSSFESVLMCANMTYLISITFYLL